MCSVWTSELPGGLHVLSLQRLPLVAGAVELAVAVFVARYYPGEAEDTLQERQDISVGIWRVLPRAGVLPLLAFKLALSASAAAVTSMGQLFAMELGFTATENALLMAYVGGLTIVSQLMVPDGVSPFLACATATLTVGGSLLGMGLTPASKLAYVLWLTPLTLSFFLQARRLEHY
eukprot:TRINITY_DN17567_c0_g1_i1.p1 TRINITY_DN17567_c0_g1~~TRINITY_DN17567_c0_g1_i1.p1  ORF type:complete len:176 (-),score=33.26 TRINITY_DN17567_c0_g1_i1:319-846(-)